MDIATVKDTMRPKPNPPNKMIALVLMQLVFGVSCYADEVQSSDLAARCSAYFFMAANTKPMDEFNDYYSGGEFAYNGAVKLVGEGAALEQFNEASSEVIELIDRKWNDFNKADERYEVICADLLREANDPDRIAASPQ
jgi:hypothetical protein